MRNGDNTLSLHGVPIAERVSLTQPLPTDEDKHFAQKIFTDYRKKPGSDYIASEFALANLSALLNKIKPTSVIEYGAGIGTMTHALLAHPVGIEKVLATETNAFCLEQLAKNIPAEYKNKLHLISNLDDLEILRRRCDLVIFDGGTVSPDEIAFLGEGSYCFIEGGRAKTIARVNAQLEKSGLICHFTTVGAGYKYFRLYKKHYGKTGKSRWKFKFRKAMKGYNIGKVSRL